MKFKLKLIHDLPFSVAIPVLGSFQSAVYTINVTEDATPPDSRWGLSAFSESTTTQPFWLSKFASSQQEANAEVHNGWVADLSGDAQITSIFSAILTSRRGKIL